MGAKRKLVKAAVLAAAPKILARVSRSRKTPLQRATHWASGLVGTRRRQTSTRRTAAQGLGAAALAIPLGLWVGRKVWGGGGNQDGDQM